MLVHVLFHQSEVGDTTDIMAKLITVTPKWDFGTLAAGFHIFTARIKVKVVLELLFIYLLINHVSKI